MVSYKALNTKAKPMTAKRNTVINVFIYVIFKQFLYQLLFHDLGISHGWI